MAKLRILSSFGISALSAAVAMSEFRGEVLKATVDTDGKKIRKHRYPHWHKERAK